MVLVVGSCPAQLPHQTEPRCCWAINPTPTVMAGARTHGVLRSARQQHGLLRLYAAYIVCQQKRRARTIAPVQKKRSETGLVQSWTGLVENRELDRFRLYLKEIVHTHVTYAKFYVDRFRGFDSVV